MKIIWFLFITFWAAILIYTLFDSLLEYSRNDVIKRTSIVRVDELTFPAIILCTRKKQLFEWIDRFDFNRTSIIDEKRDYIESGLLVLKYCLRFNGYINEETPLRKSNSVSSVYGLKLYFTTKRFPNAELKLYVVDNHLNIIVDSVGYNVYPSDFMKIKIRKTVASRLSYPYNDCKHNLDNQYRRLNCQYQCIYEQIALKYNCTMDGYYRVKTKMDCNNWAEKTYEFNQMCSKTCPGECSMTSYELDIITRDISKHPSSTIESNIAMAITFADLSYLESWEIPRVTGWSLLSGIGGTLGFLGMSFISFLELFDLIIDIFGIILIRFMLVLRIR